MNDFLQTLIDNDYPEWELTPMGDLICPHGFAIEQDGHCPDGCESPLLTEGLI